jgi:hypothetical protein
MTNRAQQKRQAEGIIPECDRQRYRQFKDMSRQIVVWPVELKTGNLIYPYAEAATAK